jgi:hypothetical protein
MEPIMQEEKKNSTWAWVVVGIILLLAVFLWIRGMSTDETVQIPADESFDMMSDEASFGIESESSDDAELQEIDMELQAMTFSDIDADLAELEEME